MEFRRRRFLRLAAAAVAGLSASPLAWAQDYPTRAVTIVVPFTPGGSTDIIARMLAQRLEQRLGKSFVVENRPGAGTIIGATAVAKTAPDGYVLLMAPSSTMAVNVTLYKKLPTIRQPISFRSPASRACRSYCSSIRRFPSIRCRS